MINESQSASFDDEVIYIVDSDPDEQARLRELLKHLHIHLEIYSSASNFLSHLPKEPHGCLIADMNLPEMDGIALLELMAKRHQSLPTIFLTDKGSISNAVKAMQAQAIDYMEKPFIDRKLYEQVQRALKLSRN